LLIHVSVLQDFKLLRQLISATELGNQPPAEEEEEERKKERKKVHQSQLDSLEL
jgi:hypothetical protein